MDKNVADLEKWGFPLQELYRMTLQFVKQNSGKAIHISYQDNLKLIAFKQQASSGPFNPENAPALGVLDVIGKDRRMHWQMLGEISREQAMEGFIDLLDNMCSAFRPYIEAVRKNRDETLKEDLKRMEQEKLEKERKDREQKELMEEGYKEEMEKRQRQDALNKQTYQQFKTYAEKQFPGHPEQQAVLIHQLQQEHYHQYMQQLHMQGHHSSITENAIKMNATATVAGGDDGGVELRDGSGSSITKPEDLTKDLAKLFLDEQQHQLSDENQQLQSDYDDDYVLIQPAKIWTRPDIEKFKAEISAGNGDGIISIGHGETVTVRVPTNLNGKSIFWEFATDNYDIGFGIYFEWSKPVSHEVTVHVSDSDDDDEFQDEDYLSINEDLEYGSLANERNNSPNNSQFKPPITIIAPIYRRECFSEVYVGSHHYPGEGVYLLKFDNSYSIWRSKSLYYRIYYER